MRVGRDKGISLVEFVTAVTLIALVALFSAPAFYKAAANQQAAKYTNELIETLNQARVQAMKQRRPVAVCSSADGRRCTETPWEHGYIVYVDNGTPGAVDRSDRVLAAVSPDDPKVAITLHGGRYVRYSPLGALLARTVDNAAPGGDARNNARGWLALLSPIHAAHADTTHSPATPDDTLGSPSAVFRGAFVVCYKTTGRKITLSPQGRVSTTATTCG